MDEEVVIRCPNPKCKMVLEIKDINKVKENYIQCCYCGAIFPNPIK
jgi:uncharacterized C2H2 Zn-finger protein